MKLLDKFAAVQVKADERISEEDKRFCMAHQNAYNDARNTLQELKFCWESILDSQKQILAPVGESYPTMYLTDYNNLTISIRDIEKQIRKSHYTLISRIVGHFNEVYHISISTSDIEEALLPQKPQERWKSGYEEEYEQYQNELLTMTLDYQQIVTQIFNQTDGRGLWEEAEHHIKTQSHESAWRFGKPTFERKKHTIQFSNAVSSDRSLHESSKHILRGLAHFETGTVGIIPGSFSALLDHRILYDDSFTFDGCKKLLKLRIFRNGRMDIRFTEEAHAVKFIEAYLGSVR